MVQIIQRAANLSSKLPGDAFTESTMGDDVVEHLTAVDVFEDHVVVVLVCDEFAHAAYVGMVEEEGEGSFADGADFFGSVFEGLFLGFGIAFSGGGDEAGNDLYCKLLLVSINFRYQWK
jgi:hypothetical protein